MEEVQKFIDTFFKIIRQLKSIDTKDSNVILGGSCALLLHGLHIGRKLTDIDIIIYQPDADQERVLSTLESFNLIKKTKPDKDGYTKRRMKFKKDEMYLDLLIEDEPAPKDCLMFWAKIINLRVQSVDNVFKAKYAYMINDPEARSKNYVRLKDAEDFVNLKNLNFNFSLYDKPDF